MLRALAFAGLGLVLGAQLLTQLVLTLARPPHADSLLSALDRGSRDLLSVSLSRPDHGERDQLVHVVTLPAAWRAALQSPGRRSPALRVLVDGRFVELQARPRRPRDDWDPASPRVFAHLDRSRLKLVLWCTAADPCRTVVVVRETAFVAYRVAWKRIGAFPLHGLEALLALATVAFLACTLVRMRPDVHTALACGVFMCAAAAWWWSLGRGEEPPASLIGVQLLALSWPAALHALDRRGARGLLRDVLFTRDPRVQARPGWWLAIGCGLVAGAGFAGFAGASALRPPLAMPEPSELHRNQSLEIAINRVFCGTRSRLSPEHSIAQRLESDAQLLTVALRELARQAAGSLDQYCQSVVEPHINHENSLMLTMQLFLELAPELSLTGLGWCLQAVRLVVLAFFALVLLRCGASWICTGLALFLSLAVLEGLSVRYYSVYPFLPGLLVASIAVLAQLLLRGAAATTTGHLLSAAAVGWLFGFATNMRTSHAPIYLVLLTAYFVAAYRSRLRESPCRSRRWRAVWLASGAGVAALAWGWFGVLLIGPLTKEPSVARAYSYHVVMHSVVISLALPENSLSRREGMGRGDDLVGLTLARRIDPEVGFLREGYEAALFRYYCRLWQRHPREMIDVYLTKFRIAGASLISSVYDTSAALPTRVVERLLLSPLSSARSGVVLLVWYAVVLLVAGARHLRTGSPLAFIVAAIAGAAVLLQLESSLIDPFFSVSHNSALLLCILLLAVACWQLALEVAAVGALGALQRWRERRARAPRAPKARA